MRPRFVHLLVGAFALVILVGCGEEQSSPQQTTVAAPYIVVVNNPLLYFARRLIGAEVEVRLLAPPGSDPAMWRPTVAEALQLQGAELVLLNGAGYSGWLDKVSLSSNKLVVTSEAAKDQWIELDDQITHSHGPGGEHAHGGYASTTWMDMSLARVQAKAVANALQKRWPQHSATITANLRTLSADLNGLGEGYRRQARRLAERQLVYSHPVFQYFERRYQLPGRSLHWEPDAMPSDEQWLALQQASSPDALFIWEAAPDSAISARLEKLNVEYVVVAPGAHRGNVDWLAIQCANIASLAGTRVSGAQTAAVNHFVAPGALHPCE